MALKVKLSVVFLRNFSRFTCVYAFFVVSLQRNVYYAEKDTKYLWHMGDRFAVTPRRMQQDSTTRETPGKRHTARLNANGTIIL